MEQISIECKNLRKTYVTGNIKVEALRGVDLSIKMGELLILSGPSGCGKTTLISILAGILFQDSGNCKVLEHSLKDMSQANLLSFRSNNVGFVFQAFNLIPSLTAAENAAIPLIIQGMNRGDAVEKAKTYLGKFGLHGRENSLPSQLSGGQQQRVAIARAIIHEPKVIVCDEPTSALDAETGHSVMEILKSIVNSSDRSLIVVTHDSRILSFADRIARMDDGHITSIEEQK